MNLPFSPGPNLAFVLTLTGILLVYCELVWLGKIALGVVGALLTMCGIYWLARMHPASAGLELIAASVICFVLEGVFRTYCTAGAVASLLLACGSWKLYNQAPWIVARLAFPASFVFGAATVGLLAAGRRARRNKRSDL